MDNLILWSLFSVAVVAHMVLGYRCNEEVKSIGGAYIFVMAKLLTRQQLILKLTAISFFSYLILGLVITLKTFADV
jgi:hypothetical protein